MSNCISIRRKHRKVCDGALQTLLNIFDRNISPADLGTVKYGEDFTPTESVQAMIESTRGVSVFDATNQERAVTHTIYIRYIDFLTAEFWLIIPDDDIVLDILNVEDLDYRHEYQKLLCEQRGIQSADANLA